MAFTVDYNKAQQGAYLAPEGEFEITIEQTGYDKTAAGKECIKLMLRVRKDVLQNEQGELIKYKLYKRTATNDYSPGEINAISKAADLGNGKTYNDIDAWLHALVGRPMRVTIKHEDYNGSTTAKVAYVNTSNFPNVSAGFVAVDANTEMPF